MASLADRFPCRRNGIGDHFAAIGTGIRIVGGDRATMGCILEFQKREHEFGEAVTLFEVRISR